MNLSSTVHQRCMLSFIQDTTPCRFHRVREAIALWGIGFYHLRSEKNPADIMSKHWGYMSAWHCCVVFFILEGRYYQDEELSMGRRLAHGTIEFMGVVSLYQG